VQAAAGVEMLAKPGDTVTEGQDLLRLYTDEPERFPRALAALGDGVVVSDPGSPYVSVPLVIDRVAG
jgi:thymidine phosphorylase